MARGPVRRTLSAISRATRRSLHSSGHHSGIGAISIESRLSHRVFHEWFSGGSWEAYLRTPIVSTAIDLTAQFTTRKGFTIKVIPLPGMTPSEDEIQGIKESIEQTNIAVNMDDTLWTAIVQRDVNGRAGFEIVRSGANMIVRLLMIDGRGIRPKVNTETMTIEEFRVMGVNGEVILAPDEMLYFPRKPLPRDMRGFSAVESVEDAIRLRRNLWEDLLQMSKRMWAPSAMFQVDTSAAMDDDEEIDRILRDVLNSYTPGYAMAYNEEITYTKVDLTPDINGLIRAIEMTDQEILGNWGIPKALVSREKTITRATLEFSLQALHDGPIAGLQRYFKRQLEAQWYPILLKDIQIGEGTAFDKYRVEHLWNPVSIISSESLKALASAFKVGAITKKQFFEIMGWDVENIPEDELEEMTPLDAMAPIDGVGETLRSIDALRE